MLKPNSLKKSTNFFEEEINNYKTFYKKYLLKSKDKRQEILSELAPLLKKLQSFQGESFFLDSEYIEIKVKTDSFLKKYFGEDILVIYNKEVPYKKSRIQPSQEDSFWYTLFTGLANSFETIKNKINAEVNYKVNFLNFLKDCLNNQGLHKYILQRDPRIYKRFNLLVIYNKGKQEFCIARTLLTHNELESDYLSPFYKGKQIFINGTIIKANNISSFKITTTTLFHEDELALFANMKDYSWNKNTKDEIAFSKHCLDETNIYLKNPNSEKAKKPFKNGSLTYINQTRIEELSIIRSKEFDISRLIVLCEELNQNSTMGSVISVVTLQRTIINFVPPIFGHANFGQLLAQYPFGKSIKKCLDNLHNSMKNISDHNLHFQASKFDSLPNITQVDFSNDLDVLLSEVCKALKEKESKKRIRTIGK